MTPEQLKARKKKERDAREEKACRAWAQEDERLQKYMDDPPSNLDLTSPTSPADIAMAATVELLWVKLEKMGILVPKHEKATWHNILYLAKAAGYFEVKKAKIPWNLPEFHKKSLARLGKLRNKGTCFVFKVLFSGALYALLATFMCVTPA